MLTDAGLTWLGWAADIEPLTRISPSWPVVTPWGAMLLTALGAAALLQSGQPSRGRVWGGRGLALAVVAVAGTFIAEWLTARSFGLDEVWFEDTVRLRQASWPGRPSPQTAVSVGLVAATTSLMRLERGTRMVWQLCMAGGAVIPMLTFAAYLFDAMTLVGVSASTGQAISTAAAFLLLIVAAALARPDRLPLVWLLGRADRRALIRLIAILGAIPVVMALSRAAFLAIGVRGEHTEWSLSIVVGTLVVGALTFYLSQREQGLLIEKESVSNLRADAEMRYRILADNAVDVIVHLRGREAALGGPRRRQRRWADRGAAPRG